VRNVGDGGTECQHQSGGGKNTLCAGSSSQHSIGLSLRSFPNPTPKPGGEGGLTLKTTLDLYMRGGIQKKRKKKKMAE